MKIILDIVFKLKTPNFEIAQILDYLQLTLTNTYCQCIVCQGVLIVVDNFKNILLKQKYNKLLSLQHFTKLTI